MIDTREKTPLRFENVTPHFQTIVRTVYPGDYTIVGYERQFAVERKSLSDLVGTILESMDNDHRRDPKTGARVPGRFRRELAALGRLPFGVVAVTEPLVALKAHKYRSLIHPNAVIGYAMSLQATYAVPFMFFGSARETAEWLVSAADHWVRNNPPDLDGEN